jgi:hypothetical protein
MLSAAGRRFETDVTSFASGLSTVRDARTKRSQANAKVDQGETRRGKWKRKSFSTNISLEHCS